MNIAYLIQTLKTTKLTELVENLDLPLVDINLAIWDSEKAGEITIDQEKDKVEIVKDYEIYCNEDIKDKIIRVMNHYAGQELNITRGRLNTLMKTEASPYNYPWHEYIMTLQALIDRKEVIEFELTVPEIKKKRPYHKFVFLCFPDNDNEEWNAKEVNKFISSFENKKVK